jgi:curved DNA-binding protein
MDAVIKDYYKILGVNQDASEEKIRERWLELVKHHHPDLESGDVVDDRIKEINEAYQVLK